MEIFIKNNYSVTILLLCLNVILVFCLFQPNIIYWLHKRWFVWRFNPLTAKNGLVKTSNVIKLVGEITDKKTLNETEKKL